MPARNRQAYIRQMLKNKCLDHLRREEVKGKYIEFYKRMASLDYDTYYEDQMERIYKIIDDMPPPTGIILMEVFLKKKRYKEVAEEMGISTSTVKKHICKALKQLRQLLRDQPFAQT